MEISLGFLIVLTIIIFPGLLYRRLYFFGEFSKEFNVGNGIIILLAQAVVPGLVLAFVSCLIYQRLFYEFDFAEIIDRYKDVVNPEVKFNSSIADNFQKPTSQNPKVQFNNDLKSHVLPLIGFEYLLSILLGSVAGRLIRITRLDTRFKILRFKNYWFYIFNAEFNGLKKFNQISNNDGNHVLTKADILINIGSESNLYSGIIVDYELSPNDPTVLSKIFLRNAQRYKLVDNVKRQVEIPGNVLIVDCANMSNINLTYVYERRKSFLETAWPGRITLIFGLLMLGIIPFFIFRASWISYDLYNEYFNLTWYSKTILYLLFTQVLVLLNPFTEKEGRYLWVSTKLFFLKVALIIFFTLIFMLLV